MLLIQVRQKNVEHLNNFNRVIVRKDGEVREQWTKLAEDCEEFALKEGHLITDTKAGRKGMEVLVIIIKFKKYLVRRG